MLHLFGEEVPLPYRVIDPRTGEVVAEGVRPAHNAPIPDSGEGPRVYICLNQDL